MSRTERLAQPQSFGRYQLIARLAHGRMGDVYKGKSQGVEGFERILVIKTINPALASIQSFVDIVVDEAQRAVALSHANVVQVLDLGREEASQTVYIATEFVNGVDLKRALNIAQHTNSPLPADLALFIASEIANGLDYAHRRKDFNFNKLNLIHRNLTPYNVMLSSEGDVKITDFGIARAMDIIPPGDQEEVMRRTIYSAPEVARGEAAHQQSDLFSLALLIPEMLQGQHPYYDPNPQVMIDRARAGQLPPMNTFDRVPPALMPLLEQMCQPDPAVRIDSSGQVYEELIGFIYGNNLKVDARALSIYIQELKKEEPDIFPDIGQPIEAGMEEVSLSDMHVPENVQSYFDEDEDDISEMTRDALPRQKFQHLFKASDPLQQDQNALPGALEEHFRASRAGQGQGVLIWGQLGAGRDYLPDRLSDILNVRGNTQSITIQVCRDDQYRPFGAMSKALFEALLPYVPEGRKHDTNFAIEFLQQINCPEEGIELLSALWGISDFPKLGYKRVYELLGPICQHIIAKLCERATVVFVFDRVEHLDVLSTDILRHLLTMLGQLPVMIIMSTTRMEEMRNKLDSGQNKNLHTVKVVGAATPKLANTKDLSANATDILSLLAVADVPLSQSDISRMLGNPSTITLEAIKELVEFGIVRVPKTGTFLSSIPELAFWVEQRFGPKEVKRHARTLTRYMSHNAQLVPQLQPLPTQVRLWAMAQERQRLVKSAKSYQQYLQNAGFFRTALVFQKRYAETLTGRNLGMPHLHVKAMLQHAAQALQLGKIEEGQASLSPLPALCEQAHDEYGRIRTILLFAALQMRQDDLEEAYNSLQDAIHTAEALNHPELLIRSFMGCASYYERFGDTLSAQRMIERAMHIVEYSDAATIPMSYHASILHLAVNIYCSRGMVGQARRIQEDLQTMANNASRADITCKADVALAYIRIAGGNYDRAKAILIRAEQNALDYDQVALAIEIARQHASFSINAQDLRAAQTKLEQLIQHAQVQGDVYSVHRASDMLAYCKAMSAQQDVRQSIELIQNSLNRATKRDIPKDIFRCHNFLAQIAQRYQRHQDAQSHNQIKDQMALRMRFRAF